jgi:hypothetical protein
MKIVYSPPYDIGYSKGSPMGGNYVSPNSVSQSGKKHIIETVFEKQFAECLQIA